MELQAALKAESNFVSGGSVLKLEVQILRRLSNKPYVAQLIHSGKRESYSYVVMTLLGESLRHITKRLGRIFSVSTQVRIGINVLFGLKKQIHDFRADSVWVHNYYHYCSTMIVHQVSIVESNGLF
ncbi:hypothetical protein COOONC_18881 [Cooperia oncophora]